VVGVALRRPAVAASVLGPYALGTVANAVVAARSPGVTVPRVAAATTVLHLSYGLGVLRGFVQV
jgi:hypothetical protein